MPGFAQHRGDDTRSNYSGYQPSNHPSQHNGSQHGGQQQPSQSGKPASGGFDGPSESGRRGTNPFGPGLGYDPAKPVVKQSIITNTRMELPPEAYALDNKDYTFPEKLPRRPGLNTTGKAIQVRVNQFKVTQWPQNDVYQYDIQIGTGAEKMGLIMAVWKSRTVQTRLRQIFKFQPLWDGNKLAWSSFDVPETRINIDWDVEKGRPPRPDSKTTYVIIKRSKVIRMAAIAGYLSGQTPFDSTILEAINFLDHAIRQGPSEMYTMIKRSFFTKGGHNTPLDNVVMAMKGVYASIRLCDPKSSVGAPSTGLALNVDCANGTFWAAQEVHQVARNYCQARNRQLSWEVFRDNLKPSKDQKGNWTMSEDFKNLRKMTKLRFTVKHRQGKSDAGKEYSIKKFMFDVKLAPHSANAKNTVFILKRNGVERQLSVYQYFLETYNMRLQFPELPLIETERAGMFPMEVCTLVGNQRYNFKLSPDQTSAMIKFAVTRPKERIASINHGVGMLKWNDDIHLKHYGIKFDPQMTLTQAKLLQNPEVQFGNNKLNPGTTGRWDLRGKKFLLPNTEPLNSWGFCILGGATSEQNVRNFANVFVQTYIGHGGKITNKIPAIYNQPNSENLPQCIASARTHIGNQVGAVPQIIFFVMPGRDSFMYERLKRNMECRFSMLSQCLNVGHVLKAQPQYCSNVCMKVNAKLGGTTSRVATQKDWFTRPTMIIGSDVSHPAPGSPQASMAAITMSMDKFAARYAAAVQTNGIRVEMITEENFRTMLIPLFRTWVKRVGGGGGPQHIYYFRDGVSEGQYAHVLDMELKHMKKAIGDTFGEENMKKIKFTVVVCTKRHHIRFFPREGDSQAADRNNNALPGTLVERDITHPFEYDFYLCSHSAIQGTARPVHYHVLKDEMGVPVNDLQKMIYQFSYQYMRSTTPVSLFPAVYYAHLASNRARAHDNAPASDGPRGGQKFEELRQDIAVHNARVGRGQQSSTSGTQTPSVALPLTPLGNPEDPVAQEKIRSTMWYI